MQAHPAPGELAVMGRLEESVSKCFLISLLVFSKDFCFFTSWCLFHNSTQDALKAGEKEKESATGQTGENGEKFSNKNPTPSPQKKRRKKKKRRQNFMTTTE